MWEVRPLNLFAVAAPGLERVVATELHDLGIDGVAETGGVSWEGPHEQVYRANLHLRSASRVLVRVARFRARTFIEMERHVRRIDWSAFLADGAGVRLRISSRKSKLYHERAIEERFARYLAEAGVRPVDSGSDDDEPDPSHGDAQLVVVRFRRDECLVSADSSGDLLHRRGYRQVVAKAPVRETLGAAMLLASSWAGTVPLLDPLCGAGTIAIEGALIARGIPPGLASRDRGARRYAFQAWPRFDPAAWETIVAKARAGIRRSASIPIMASDRDAGAIEAARQNAVRAGVENDIEFDTRALSLVEPPAGPGWLVTNPPYGVRVGDRRPLRDLYATLGKLARGPLAGWTLTLLSPDDQLERQLGMELREILRTENGGIPVRLVTGTAARG